MIRFNMGSAALLAAVSISGVAQADTIDIPITWTYRSLEDAGSVITSDNAGLDASITETLNMEADGVPANPSIWDSRGGDVAQWPHYDDGINDCNWDDPTNELRLIRGEFELPARPGDLQGLTLSTVNLPGEVSVNDWIYVHVNGVRVAETGTRGPGTELDCPRAFPEVGWCEPGDLTVPDAVLNWGGVNEIKLVLNEQCTSGGLQRIEFVSLVLPDEDGPACVFGSQYAQIANRANVTSSVGSNGWVDVQAGDRTRRTLVTGDITAGSWVTIGAGVTTVDGDVTAAGAVNVQLGAVVTGTVSPNTAVPPVTLETRTVTPGTQNYYVQPGSSCLTTLPGGNYGDVYVNQGQGCRLVLQGGEYQFRRLVVNAGAALEVLAPVTIATAQEFTFGDRAVLGGAANPSALEVYSNQSIRIGTGTAFKGMLLAPAGDVTVSDNSSFAGCVRGMRTRVGVGVVFTGAE